MPKPRIIKPTKYLQDALTGANPKERHKCKQPCKGASRRMFGFFDPRKARPSAVHVVDSYDVVHVEPKPFTLSPHWNTKPTKRFAPN